MVVSTELFSSHSDRLVCGPLSSAFKLSLLSCTLLAFLLLSAFSFDLWQYCSFSILSFLRKASSAFASFFVWAFQASIRSYRFGPLPRPIAFFFFSSLFFCFYIYKGIYFVGSNMIWFIMVLVCSYKLSGL